MKATTIAYNSFFVLTILYFVVKDFFTKRNKDTRGLFMIYFLLLIGIQSLTNFRILSENECKNLTSISFYIGIGIAYWIFIFLAVSFLIERFSGWKSIFSNTFGYMFVMIFGVKKIIDTFFNEIMNSYKTEDKKEIFSMIYRDRSLILNEITPKNIKNLVEVMIGETPYKDLINKNIQSEYTYQRNITSSQQSALENLEVLLHRKDNVASLIWYLLAGTMTISFIHMLIMRPKCSVTYNDVKEIAKDSYKKGIQDTGTEDFVRDASKTV